MGYGVWSTGSVESQYEAEFEETWRTWTEDREINKGCDASIAHVRYFTFVVVGVF